MARIRHSDSTEALPGFVTAYMETLEDSDGVCVEFTEPHAHNKNMVRIFLTRAEAGGLVGRLAMLLARGHGIAEPNSDQDIAGL